MSGKLTDEEKTILDMFSYMRPMGSPTEQAFIDRFLVPLGFTRDRHKNLVLKIGENPRILFSSHVDTVHCEEGIQPLHYDRATGMLSLAKKARRSSCLGGDCTAGVWLMTELVKARVEGVYVIHHGEEQGCIGSSALAQDVEFFTGIDFAIAFDRMGYDSIITHQCGRRTASDAFGQSFKVMVDSALGDDSQLKLDDGGVYTDTNEYADIVAECTNICVGYDHQHSHRETQSVGFLLGLKDVLVKCDWTTLVAARDPKVIEYAGMWSHGARRYNFGHEDFTGGWDTPWSNDPPVDYGDFSPYPENRSELSFDGLVVQYPDIATQILSAFGVTRSTFLNEVEEVHGSHL